MDARTNAWTDSQKTLSLHQAFLRRCTRLQLYWQCDPTVNQLVEDMENKLFTSVINNDKHVLSHTSYLILIITLIISGLGDMN